ncbi:MAG: glycosyltransferase family 2 protein [Pseudomonadota bacterium]
MTDAHPEEGETIAAVKPKPTVSAVVVSYFTGPVLARAIAALSHQDAIAEIVLVDNGNFPGDIEKAAADMPVKILTGHGNIGFAAGCNLGAKSASGDFLLIINPDAILPDGGAARLLSDGAALAQPWLMGAKLVDPDGTEQQGSRRAVLTPWRVFIEATHLYRLAPRHPYFQRFNLHTEDCPDDIIETPTISGAAMFLPRADFESIGGMDEHYFMHVEDVDFCLRFAKAGGKIYFTPHVAIIHYKSSSRANAVKIEARKTAGVVRYFHTHFADVYPRPFLWLVDGALWASFGALFIRRALGRVVRTVGFRLRSGGRGMKRARAISRRQSDR